MGNDLPDFQSQVVGAGLEATSFVSGLDTDKAASPAAGDIWLARDTGYLYVCNVAGSWDKVTKLYLLLAGGTMSGAIAMGSNKITGMGDPTANQDAATKAYTDARIPSGLIAMWHGLLANIPTGWVLCDGNNGTPNLLARFVQGVATAATNPGATGGAKAKTTAGHTHSIVGGAMFQVTGGTADLTTSTDSIADIRPPYYDVAFIMKT